MSDYNDNTALKIVEFSRALKEKKYNFKRVMILKNINTEERISFCFYCDPTILHNTWIV